METHHNAESTCKATMTRGLMLPIAMTAAVAISAWGHASAAELAITILDGDTDKALPARVRVRDTSRSDHLPADASVVRIGPADRWFACDGHARLDVPVGRYDILVEHGKEYEPARQAFDVGDSEANRCEVRLRRWIDMRERGWLSGENHVHVVAKDLAAQAIAEGLDFATTLQWWNGPKQDPPAGGQCLAELRFAGRTIRGGLCDFEIENGWGAVYGLGMAGPLTVRAQNNRPNGVVLHQMRAVCPLICYQGGWSAEVLPNALHGLVDVVNVCNNNFQRFQYQPRPNYSNLLNVEGFPTYGATPEGMMQMNTDTWYRLLNCGLKLAAGAGSAAGFKYTPVGYNRAYVRTSPMAALAEFLDAWRRGRNFVTNGPMLFLKVNGDKEPGDTIDLGTGGGRIRVEVEAVSDQELGAVEIVVNGRVIEKASTQPVGGKLLSLSSTFDATESIWIAARCTDEDRLLTDDELAAYQGGSPGYPLKPCRLRFAHTSPVYVTVDGKSVRLPVAIDEARRMLDAFETFAAHFAGPEHAGTTRVRIEEARKRLGP